MRKFYMKVFISILSILLISNYSYAGGIQLYEQGQPNSGAASAGQVALADDASTAYFNPAGMIRLERSELVSGTQLVIISSEFHDDGNSTFRGSDGGQAGGIFPGGGFYLTYKINPNIAAGLSVNAPVGLGMSYHDDWKGRYLLQNSFMAVVDIDPTIAVRLTDWLSVGGGVDVYYGFLKQDSALYNPAIADGQIELKRFDDWAVGYNLGLLLEPLEKTRIGVTYRSQVDLELEGDIDLSGLGTLWTLLGLQSTFAKTDLTIPRSITASLYQDLTDKLAFLFDVGWQNWSSMEKTEITTQTGRNVTIKRNWDDTWRLAAGLQYRLFDPLSVKIGASYDSSPTSKEDRLPDIPVDRQWRYAAGLDYDINEDVTVGINYVFLDMGPAEIDKTVLSGARRFSGDYDQFANIVSVYFRWKFGE